MSDRAIAWLLDVAALGMFALVVTPVLSFLFQAQGWKARRSEILDGLDDEAAGLYFESFHPEESDGGAGPRARLEAYYDREFGQRAFIVPLLLYGTLVSLLLVWTALTVLERLSGRPPSAGALPPTVMSALLGAYTWVAYDQIARWYDVSLSPVVLYWAAFRMAIAVPMGLAFAASVKDEVAVPLVFLLGAFPTNALMTLGRRVALRQMGWGDSSDSGRESELQAIQGIDTRKAEAFAAEGITTILQLAYTDPIRLTIRTNLGFSFVNDCVGQALLAIYVEDALPKLRKYGLRSSYEVVGLHGELESEDQATADAAKALVDRIANDLGWPIEGLRNVIDQVGQDPYADFLYHSWASGDDA